jgi:hypothetical protein
MNRRQARNSAFEIPTRLLKGFEHAARVELAVDLLPIPVAGVHRRHQVVGSR